MLCRICSSFVDNVLSRLRNARTLEVLKGREPGAITYVAIQIIFSISDPPGYGDLGHNAGLVLLRRSKPPPRHGVVACAALPEHRLLEERLVPSIERLRVDFFAIIGVRGTILTH